MILLIDNYDSFTYNLFHYLISAGAKEVLVKRNDNILKLGSDSTEAPKFEELTKDLGMKLLSPLLGNCFLHVSSQTKIRDSIERRYLVIQILCWGKHRVVSR